MTIKKKTQILVKAWYLGTTSMYVWSFILSFLFRGVHPEVLRFHSKVHSLRM